MTVSPAPHLSIYVATFVYARVQNEPEEDFKKKYYKFVKLIFSLGQAWMPSEIRSDAKIVAEPYGCAQPAYLSIRISRRDTSGR